VKRTIILAAYAAIAATDASTAQMFSPGAMIQQTQTPPVLTQMAVKPAPLVVPERIVITYGAGGVIRDHHRKYQEYVDGGKTVEIRGPCYSACTLITAYFGKDKLCIAEGAFFAFHAARTARTHEILPYETERTYWEQPTHIRDWIDRNGGWNKLPLDGYWTMYDRDLWAMGYPKCQS
jgi:hypothetical protein